MLSCLDEGLSLESVAAQAASSPYHFQRCFLSLVGESPDDCLRRLRMEKAAFLLRKGSATVLQVALDSGYESPEAFSRAFRRAWGISPKAIKRLPTWEGSLPSPSGIHYHPQGRERWYFISPETGEAMQTKIVMMEERRLFGLWASGDPWQLPGLWSRLPPILEASGITAQVKAWLSVLPAAGSAPGQGRLGAAVEVLSLDKGGPACPPGLEEYTLPGGLTAVVVHFGSSEEIGSTVERWESQWLPSSSWEEDKQRPRWEWYQNGNLAPELQITFWCASVRRAADL